MENVPIRMRVVYKRQRVEFTTGYRIDVAKWDTNKQRVKNGCTGMFFLFSCFTGLRHNDYKAMRPYIDIADDIRANAMDKFNQI